MTKPLQRTLMLIHLCGGCVLAQSSSVPTAYQATYTQLQNYISSFDSTVTSQWNGKKSNVLWSGELLYANANIGLPLIQSSDANAIAEINLFHQLGQRSVTVNIAFPILTKDFYTFNGDPGDYQQMVNFYANLATQIHKLGMKMVVESAIMFTGSAAANSGLDISAYYSSLSDEQFVAERVQNVLTVAQQVGPDYINLNSEPDTELELTGRTSLYGSAAGFAGMIQTIVSELHAAGVTIPLGSGVGTWLKDGNASNYVTAILGSGVDYLDMHVYPVNFGTFLPALITYADLAQQAGKPVAISEAWLLKESDSEILNQNSSTAIANNSVIFARDPYSFWAPLDQAFLQALSDFANWKGLIYVSPFWTQYFAAYLDYNAVANLPPATVNSMETQAAEAALAANRQTPTAAGYRNNTGGIIQIPLVSAADFKTKPVAADSLITIFGTNLSSGTKFASSLPLPTMLDNTSATITDSSGNQEPIPLIYVSPTQINGAIPPGLATGVAILTISNNGTVIGGSNAILDIVGPSLFTANGDGQGPPIGLVVTVNASGAESTQSTYQGSTFGQYTPAPIDLGGTGDSSVLVLYGTGIRGVPSLSKVTASIGSTKLSVLYAGPCDPTHFFAFDQVNLALPQSLAGSGQVNLTLKVNGVAADTVTLDFK